MHRTLLASALLATLTLPACSRHTSQAQSFPDLPAPRQLEPGISFFQVTLIRNSVPMKLWLYLPANATPDHTLPCVLIAPAGTRLFHGIELGDGDRAEHLPYVRHSFAVLAYELDGTLPDHATNAQTSAAISAFKKADAGMANARAAIDYAQAKIPHIDLLRLYAVGHSSAATLALQLAAHEPRIAACVAYAPACSLSERVSRAAAALDRLQPGTTAWLDSISPDKNLAKLTCPTLLFTALDDSNVPSTSVMAFFAQLLSSNPRAKLLTVPTGNHYDSMIQQGIPAGIKFLQSNIPSAP